MRRCAILQKNYMIFSTFRAEIWRIFVGMDITDVGSWWKEHKFTSGRVYWYGPMLMEFTDLTVSPTILKQLVWWNSGMVFGTLSYTAPARWQYIAGLGQVSPGSCIWSKSVSNVWCYFSHSQDSRIHESRGRNRNATAPIISSDPLAKCLLPVPVNLCSVGLKVLVAKGKLGPPGDTTLIPSNWQLRLPWPLWAYCASESIGKEGCYSSGWDDWSKLLRDNWAGTPQWRYEEYIWNVKDLLGCLLILPCPKIKINVKI